MSALKNDFALSCITRSMHFPNSDILAKRNDCLNIVQSNLWYSVASQSWQMIQLHISCSPVSTKRNSENIRQTFAILDKTKLIPTRTRSLGEH